MEATLSSLYQLWKWIPWCGPQHVGVEPSQCLSVSYDHGIGLPIPWCGPQHVGVEPSQCLSVSYEHGLGLLIPWCGPQHVGVEPSQCLSVSYEHGLGLLIPWWDPQHVGVEPSQCFPPSNIVGSFHMLTSTCIGLYRFYPPPPHTHTPRSSTPLERWRSKVVHSQRRDAIGQSHCN